MPAGNQNSLIKKAFAQNRAKALKFMRFLGLVASQGGLFHLPENIFLKKVLQKRLNTKIFISDKPEFCGAIGAGLLPLTATDCWKGSNVTP